MLSAPDSTLPVSQPLLSALAGSGRQAFLQSLSQHARLITIETPLEAGALIVERFSGHEAMSELFRFEVDCLATTAHFELKALAGAEVSLRLLQADGRTRSFHGIVTRVRQMGGDGSLARYRLTLEPWMHALTLRRDSYVFQDMTVLDIVEDVLRDYPNASYRFDVKAVLPKRSLAMQYRESDYDFLKRLLAEEGLNFFFDHADEHARPSAAPSRKVAGKPEAKNGHARHQVVVFDDKAALAPSAQPSIRFRRTDATETADTVTLFAQCRQVRANAVTLSSWDYKKLAATSAGDMADHPDSTPSLEVFEGAGTYRYTDAAESARIARARAESLALAHQAMHAESSVRALAVGTCFALTDHPDADGEYTVLSIAHEGANNLSAGITDLSARAVTEPGTYRNQFTCIARATPIRPPYWYPKPTAPGTQVALVVGIGNEEITTERGHRIKVQFPWQRGDRAVSGQVQHPVGSNAPGNESAGTWIRVAEPVAGANWGAHFVPRIGQEVCVDFIGGDIDRPVVTGQLYNGTDTPPLHGADNHPGALAGIRTREYAASGFNQWLIDDTPGQLRQAAASSYPASQLNIGYLIHQNGNVRGAYRGIGFELATDAWSTLRAKRGMFISTTQRNGAVSTQFDAQEAQGKLKSSEELAKALSDAAVQHHALPFSTPGGMQQLSKTVSGTDTVDGQKAPKFDQPLTLIDSQAGISTATSASSTMLAGHDMTMTSASATRITAGQTVTFAAASAASLFTHTGGAKVIAAKEALSACAHTGPMDVLADEAITVTSSNASIKVQAKQEILLASGGGYIKLAGSNIDIHCPSLVSVKGNTHDFLSAGGRIAIMRTLPNSRADLPSPPAGFDEMFHLVDSTDNPLPNTKYRITGSNGQLWEGVTDSDGFTQRVYTTTQVDLSIEVLESEDQQATRIVE